MNFNLYESTDIPIFYLAGPVTGTDDYFERFKRYEIMLNNLGLNVINPTDHGFEEYLPDQERILRECFKLLDICKAVFLLPHWENSKGTRKEIEYARKLHLPIFKLEILEE